MARRGRGIDLGDVTVAVLLIGFVAVCALVLDGVASVARKSPLLFWLVMMGAGGAVIALVAQVSRSGMTGSLADTNVIADRASASAATLRSVPPVAFVPVGRREKSLEEKLASIDWFQFERLVALLYRERGFQVNRRGGANPDGGIDLVVHDISGAIGVQCKFWKAWKVGVRNVRELIGGLTDAGLQRGVIVSIKGFTDEARELAARHGIELMGEGEVLRLIKLAMVSNASGVQSILDANGKTCPKCESEMVERVSRRDGSRFWGCSTFPRWRYKMPMRSS